MLHADVVRHAVPIAEVEQPGADDRGDVAVHLERGRADRARFGVGEVQALAISGDAHRLRQRCLTIGPVDDVLGASPGVHARLATRRVHLPELVNAGHGDVERASHERDVPGRRQRAAVEIGAGAELPARAGDRARRSVREIDRADDVVSRVGDVQRVAIEREPLRVAQGRSRTVLRIRAIATHDALDVDALTAHTADQYPVVPRVGDGNPIAVDRDLARVAK